MTKPLKILLQTTIAAVADDWHIGRFSLLESHLRSLTNADGAPLYEVTGRNRETDETGNDPLLSSLDESEFDQLWLFAVDTGNGLTSADCAGITSFRKRGGGIFSTRDHFDLGSSLCTLGGIGAAHYFHSINPDPDPDRNRRDNATSVIDYPNYHSGANGDYQPIKINEPHELLRREDGSAIEFFPAHPHEGGVGAPEGDASAHVIATGTSMATDRPFNLVVAFENSVDKHGNNCGRAIAESSFHHLVDYNWDTEMGCPTFLEEPPGYGYNRNPKALDDIKQYVANVAAWLSSGK
ncbi:MAG: hypothetical protein ABI646_11225 [Acidobacteriota bacterium]